MKRFAAVFILFITSQVIAQPDEYIFKQLTEADGLSQSTVYSIIQDKMGYLWFGTIEGLNRYDGYEFRVYTNDPSDSTSISDDFISTICEDSKGFIWVGTVNGYFNKFDRKSDTFKRFHVNDYFKVWGKPEKEYYEYPISFSRNHDYTVTSIAEDADSTLWIATWGNGLLRFDKKSEKAVHYYHIPSDSSSLTTNRIMKILVDIDSNIWIATFGGGLNKVVRSHSPGSTNSKILSDNISFIAYRNAVGNDYSLGDDKVITLFEDNRETLWIGMYDGGLNKLDHANKILPPTEAKFKRYTVQKNTTNCLCNNTILDIVQDFDGYLWLATFGGGIDRMDIQSESFSHFYNKPNDPNPFPDNEILSLLVDRSGILWVGAFLGEGVTKLQKNIAKFKSIKKERSKSEGLNDNVVWSIYKDNKDNLWIGTYKGGLNLIDQRNRRTITYQHDDNDINSISNNHIRAIEQDAFNNLWIGTYNGGVNRFNIKTGKFERFIHDPNNANSLSANQVQDIYIESDTVIWVATFGGGLNKLSFKTNSSNGKPGFTVYKNDPSDSTSISDNRVYSLLKDSKGNFWVGTYGGGLNKFNQRLGTFKSLKHNPKDPNSLSSDKVLSIQEDRSGIIWIGTSGGGLNKFNPKTNIFTQYSSKDGLTSAVVYGLLEDNSQNFWMSTDNGIYRFDQEDGKFTHFGLGDGLLSLEFSGGAYFKDKSGQMYFGGIKGLNYFYPDSISTNIYIPPVVISSINIFTNRIKGESDKIILTYDQNFISFEFSALDFTNPEKNQYAFMMEGLDKSWKYVGSEKRIANYINLPTGKYIFHVTGTNSDGLWNRNGTAVTLIITPPFWLTWWFITLVIILVGSVLYYLSTIRIKHQLAIEKLKTKLAADLHDNVGASLTEISILSEVAAQKSNGKFIPKELKSISEIARQLVDTLSDIVFVVNPEKDSLFDLIIKLKDSYNEFLNSVGVSFKVKNIDKTNDIILPMEFKQNLLLIFKEGINNCIKHSKCTKIILEAKVRGDIIEMILSDDGIGFDELKENKGNGLKNMELRARKLDGRMKWRSSIRKGTVITFIGKIGKFNRIKSLLNK